MTKIKIIITSLILFLSFTPFIHAAETDDWWYTTYDSQTAIAANTTTTTTTTTTGQATTMPVSGNVTTTLILAGIGLALMTATFIYRSKYSPSK
jgi:hypothetical protein